MARIAAFDLVTQLIGLLTRFQGGEETSMMSDMHDLWRDRHAIGAALDYELLAEDDPVWRVPDLDRAIRETRPCDPVVRAIQMRLIAHEFAASGHVKDESWR